MIQQVHSTSSNTHNHDLLEAAAFSRYRAKGTAKQGDEIVELWKLGFRPSEILIKLRANPDSDVRLEKHNGCVQLHTQITAP